MIINKNIVYNPQKMYTNYMEVRYENTKSSL